jgi:hypothetical protein
VYDDPNKPATWVQEVEEQSGDGTWGTPASELIKVSEDYPLTPFRKRLQKTNTAGEIDQGDLGAFYTSKDVRSLEASAYLQ